MIPALTALYDARFFVSSYARGALAQYRSLQSAPQDSIQRADSAASLAYHMDKLAEALAQEERAIAVLEGRSAPEANHAA